MGEGIDWAAEAQHALHGILRDVLAATDPAAEWAAIIDRRLTPALVEPDVAHAVLLEAVGVTIVTLICVGVWMDKTPTEVLDLVQCWRLPQQETA